MRKKNIVRKMSKFTHVLDEYFEAREYEFTNEVNNKCTKFKHVAVVCKHLKAFIDFVIKYRNLSDYHLKFGLYGEGKFL